MSIDEQIEVLKAYKEGKTIQMRDRDPKGNWFRRPSLNGGYPSFDFAHYDYRVESEENTDPMTIEMLTEWLAKGNGLAFDKDEEERYYFFSSDYLESDKKKPVEQSCRVKKFLTGEVLIPTKELYYKDCCRTRKDDFEERFVECLKKYMSENKS